MGRRRYDAQFSAVLRALFELFVLIERALFPACRLLLPGRASPLREDHGVEVGPRTTRVALGTALVAIPSPKSAEEIDSLLRAYVVELPDAVTWEIALRRIYLPRARGTAGRSAWHGVRVGHARVVHGTREVV